MPGRGQPVAVPSAADRTRGLMAGAASSSWDEGLGSGEAAGAADGMDIEISGDKARDPSGKKLSTP